KMPYGSELLRCLPDNTWDRAGFCVNRPASPFCPLGCLNNGICTDFYKCTCPQGFMGKRCEQREFDYYITVRLGTALLNPIAQ
ncbi:unnamed protein product, partial [Notodromas monacha]